MTAGHDDSHDVPFFQLAELKKDHKPNTVIIISADAEWAVVMALFHACEVGKSPFGEYFAVSMRGENPPEPIVVFHGGWGKIAAAASTQHVIERWAPSLLVNLGTCGGINGRIEKGAIVLAEKTLVRDIVDLMGDQQAEIKHYTTAIDLTWMPVPWPRPVLQSILVSADHDMLSSEIRGLVRDYGSVAADWESGAIAWVAKRNDTRCLILRCVTDLVDEGGGEAYGNIRVWQESAGNAMETLFCDFAVWMMQVAERSD